MTSSNIEVCVKAILKFHHNHTHSIEQLNRDETMESSETQYNEIVVPCYGIEYNFNEEYINNLNNPTQTLSISQILDKDIYDNINDETIDETDPYIKQENDRLFFNNIIEQVSIENKNFELSTEFQNYILVENDTENSLHNNSKSEVTQLLSNFDTTNE